MNIKKITHRSFLNHKCAEHLASLGWDACDIAVAMKVTEGRVRSYLAWRSDYEFTELDNEFLRESNAIEGVYDDNSFEQALLAWKFLMKQKQLTVDVILETHKILMKNLPLQEKYKGAFRDIPIYIGGREGIKYFEIPTAIDSWLKDVETSIKIREKDGKHIKLDHIAYEHVHPFCDGNGRTGRLFMNWQRIKVGLPLLIIHADYPKEGGEQEKYYEWFRK